MPFDFQQYQIKTEPLIGALPFIDKYESWHSPLSEPVRFKIAPRLAVALIASGLIAPVLNPQTQIINQLESRWHQGWSEPVRTKPRLHAALNPFISTYFDILPRPNNQIQGWYEPWRGPPHYHEKRGLMVYLQSTTTHPIRYLPPANVTMVMLATEFNADAAAFEVDVFTTPLPALDLTGVNISIEEIVDGDAASASIKESE